MECPRNVATGDTELTLRNPRVTQATEITDSLAQQPAALDSPLGLAERTTSRRGAPQAFVDGSEDTGLGVRTQYRRRLAPCLWHLIAAMGFQPPREVARMDQNLRFERPTGGPLCQ